MEQSKPQFGLIQVNHINTLVDILRQLFSDPQTAIGTIIFLIFLIMAIFGPMIAPYEENDQSHPVSVEPGEGFLFGTDRFGRDVYSRIILGTKSIFLKAGLGTLVAVVIGTFVGLYSGYQGGLFDEVISRLIDSFLAMPAMLIALVVLGIIKNMELQEGTFQFFLAHNSVLLVIALVYVPIVARVVRSRTLEIKTLEFVQSAQLRGENQFYILFREIFPSVVPTLVVEASLRFSYAIFLVASLGFLGVGAKPPTPDWGLMVNESRGGNYLIAPWALNYPALAISVLVIGVNLMTDGLKRIIQRGS